MSVEVGTDRFEELVLAGSSTRPVVVDFWAPWCSPCKQLTPILEEIEVESAGRWLLAKVNVDEHPELARSFGIAGIPALKAFASGRMVAETQGLATKAQLLSWLAGFVAGEELDRVEAARAAEAAGDDPLAEAEYRAALELKPGHEEAIIGLAALLERAGRLDEAAELVELLDGAVAARIRLERAAAGGPSLEGARAAARDGGPAELHALGIAEAIAGNHEAALEALLELVRRDRNWQEEAGRRTMIEVFQLAGNDSELADEYRRRLSMLLY